MKKVFVVDARRTAIVTSNGKFKSIRPEVLGARLLRSLRAEPIDEIILGNAIGTGGNIARLTSLLAELDIPSLTIDMQCASSASSITIALAKIRAVFRLKTDASTAPSNHCLLSQMTGGRNF